MTVLRLLAMLIALLALNALAAEPPQKLRELLQLLADPEIQSWPAGQLPAGVVTLSVIGRRIAA